jgi:hypothetical protein
VGSRGHIYAEPEDALPAMMTMEKRGRSYVINESTRPTRPPPRRPPAVTNPVRPIPPPPVAAKPSVVAVSAAVAVHPVVVPQNQHPPAKPKRKGHAQDAALPPPPPSLPPKPKTSPNRPVAVAKPKPRPSSGDAEQLYDNQGPSGRQLADADQEGQEQNGEGEGEGEDEEMALAAEDRVYEEPVVRRRDRTMTAKQRSRQAQSRVILDLLRTQLDAEEGAGEDGRPSGAMVLVGGQKVDGEAGGEAEA